MIVLLRVRAHHHCGHAKAELVEALGREIVYNPVTPETYRNFGFPGADDLGNMFQFKRDFNDDYRAARNIEFSRELNPELQTFERWLAQYGSEIPIAA